MQGVLELLPFGWVATLAVEARDSHICYNFGIYSHSLMVFDHLLSTIFLYSVMLDDIP